MSPQKDLINDIWCLGNSCLIISYEEMLKALASPNGVPNCDFLAGANPEYTELIEDQEYWRAMQTNKVYSAKIFNYYSGLLHSTPKTISGELFKTLCDCIEKGMDFDASLTVLDLKYSKLCPKK